jgi:hypothetical protein
VLGDDDDAARDQVLLELVEIVQDQSQLFVRPPLTLASEEDD